MMRFAIEDTALARQADEDPAATDGRRMQPQLPVGTAADFKGEELLWESPVPGGRLVEWLRRAFRVIIGRPWQRLNMGRNWLRQRSPRTALTVELGLLVLLVAGLWFSLHRTLELTPPPTATPQAGASAPPEVRLIFDSTIFCPANPVDKKAITRFAAAHRHVAVARRCISPFRYSIETGLASSPPLDAIRLFAGVDTRTLAGQGLFVDISDLWEQEGWNETYPEWLQRLSTTDGQRHLIFTNPSEPPLELQIPGTGGGQQYLLPTAYSWWAIYYSKPIFERYNLAPPRTWAELLAVSETLKRNGVTPIAFPGWRWQSRRRTAAWFDYLNMRLNGPEFHRNLLRGQERYDGPKVKAVFETWRVLVDNDYFLTRIEPYGYTQSIQFIHQGEAAMVLANSFFIRDAIPEKFQANFGSFRFPIIDPNVPIGENVLVDSYVIPANTADLGTARQFLAYLGSVEAQTYLAETPGLVPAHTGVEPSLLAPEVRQGQALIEGADYVVLSYDSGSPKAMADSGLRTFQQFLKKPDNIDSVLVALEETRQEVFAEQIAR